MTTTLPHFDPSFFAETITRAIQDGIAKAVEKVKPPVVPFDKVMWDVEQVADYMRKNPQYVRDRITCLPDFPQGRRIIAKDGHRSLPVWKAAEVVAWFETQKHASSKAGRPRKPV